MGKSYFFKTQLPTQNIIQIPFFKREFTWQIILKFWKGKKTKHITSEASIMRLARLSQLMIPNYERVKWIFVLEGEIRVRTRGVKYEWQAGSVLSARAVKRCKMTGSLLKWTQPLESLVAGKSTDASIRKL